MTALWNDILQEVLRRKASGERTSIFSDKEGNASKVSNTRNNADSASKKTPPKKKDLLKILPTYALGAKYGKMYFTKREAECMVFLLKGNTINKVAETLGLSPRTVEYYMQNMKKKIGCRTKFELVNLVSGSEFIKNLDARVQVLM